jgi:hypothetical protein
VSLCYVFVLARSGYGLGLCALYIASLNSVQPKAYEPRVIFSFWFFQKTFITNRSLRKLILYLDRPNSVLVAGALGGQVCVFGFVILATQKIKVTQKTPTKLKTTDMRNLFHICNFFQPAIAHLPARDEG